MKSSYRLTVHDKLNFSIHVNNVTFEIVIYFNLLNLLHETRTRICQHFFGEIESLLI